MDTVRKTILKTIVAEIITVIGVLIIYFSDAGSIIKILVMILGLMTSILAYFVIRKEMKNYEKKKNMYQSGA